LRAKIGNSLRAVIVTLNVVTGVSNSGLFLLCCRFRRWSLDVPTFRLALLIVLSALVMACSGGTTTAPTSAPATTAPAAPAAAAPATSPPATTAAAAQPAAKPADKPGEKPADKPVAAAPAAATPTAASAAKPAVQPTAERKFEIQVPGQIQTPGAMQTVGPMPTVKPYVYPTIPPFQVTGEIQQPGEIQKLPPYVWPTIGEFQRPGQIQVPGEIQKPGEIQAVPNVPSTAECVKTGTLQPVGTFTGESFKVQFPAATGECLIPAGLIFKSADGKQDMMVMATVKVTMTGAPQTVTVYANCIDFSKHGPEPTSKYSVGGMVGAASSLGKLIAALPSVSSDKITTPGLQAAVWAITNDVSKNSVSKVFKFEQADLDSARTILQAAKIDPASKNLFK
jgi:hypothetical protein